MTANKLDNVLDMCGVVDFAVKKEIVFQYQNILVVSREGVLEDPQIRMSQIFVRNVDFAWFFAGFVSGIVDYMGRFCGNDRFELFVDPGFAAVSN